MFLLFHEIVLICLISAYWLTFMAAVMCATEEDGVAFAEVVSVPGWGQQGTTSTGPSSASNPPVPVPVAE